MINQDMFEIGSRPSVIREIFEYSNSRKAQIGAEKVFDFSLGNPSIPAPDAVNVAIERLINTDSVKLHGYTSAAGDASVRERIAEGIRKRFGACAESGNIYMTCGAAASLTISLKAICNAGDEVLLLAPFFPEYSVFVANAQAKTVIVPANLDFSLNLEKIEAAINNKTAAIILNSPNNPTGSVLSADEIKALSSLLKKKSQELNKPIYIIADEPYRELCYCGEVPYIPNYYENTIVCYSYSKALSIPGERIGYIFISPKAQDSKAIFAAVCGAGRGMGYVCAPSLMQYVVSECDGMCADISLYDRNRQFFYKSLTEIGYDVVEPKGAFYLFVRSLEDDASAFCERAKKHELLLVPSDSFGIKGYVRISYCVVYEQIERSIPAFKKLYEEYK